MKTYAITIGEVGNEIGHVQQCRARSDAGAMRAAGRAMTKYGRDGWWIVTDPDGRVIERGSGRWQTAGGR